MTKQIFAQISCLALLTLIAQSSFSLCVKTKKANLRQGPGTKYEKTWTVFKYMPFRKVQKKGTWYRVKDLDGEIHWIYNRLTTKSYHCAVVKAKRANTRTGPSTKFSKHPTLPVLEKYTALKVLKFRGKWVKLMTEFGDHFWIHRKLLWIQ